MGLRITAAAPAIASIAATALGIVLLASGSSTGTANDTYWIAVSKATRITRSVVMTRLWSTEY